MYFIVVTNPAVANAAVIPCAGTNTVCANRLAISEASYVYTTLTNHKVTVGYVTLRPLKLPDQVVQTRLAVKNAQLFCTWAPLIMWGLTLSLHGGNTISAHFF